MLGPRLYISSGKKDVLSDELELPFAHKTAAHCLAWVGSQGSYALIHLAISMNTP